MLIGDIRGQTELFVRLAEKLFCSRSVAGELAVVGSLRIANVVEGLDNVVLRGGKIAMAVAVDVDVGLRYALGECHGAQYRCAGEGGDDDIAAFQDSSPLFRWKE